MKCILYYKYKLCYKKRGYYQIQNYGKYENNSKAICFEKNITQFN